MEPKSLKRIIAALGALPGDQFERHLCGACCELLAVSGAAVSVAADGASSTLLCSSDATAAALEDLQATLGEGPSVDAHRLGVPVGAADLAGTECSRWVAFHNGALATGAGAVFAFPLRIGGVHVGVLTLYQRRPGELSEQQYTGAVLVADVVSQTILAVQAQAPPGVVAEGFGAVADHRAEVHQAAGMLAVRLGTTVGEALVRLRAHAYAEGRPLAEVARDVVAGRSRID